jgi:hypothetical protein
MNKILFAAVLLLSISSAKAVTIDSLYIVTYTTGPLWDPVKNPGEQNFFKEHSSRLGQLRKDGVIKFGARYGDKGSIVIIAPNSEKAKQIISADAAIINKLFIADIQKLSIFYEGCLERLK